MNKLRRLAWASVIRVWGKLWEVVLAILGIGSRANVPTKYERFVAAYLRLNGFFEVPNFIVHAGDDPSRISNGVVSNYTECDTLAVRFPHSAEVVGVKHVVNHPALIGGAADKVDVIIAESKSGNENRPNKVWRTPAADPVISYIVRFVGTHPEGEVNAVATALAATYRFEDGRARYRYVMFSNTENEHYSRKGVTYITYREAIRFIVEVRGDSWIRAGLGVRSAHQQWDDMLVEMFRIANDQGRTTDQRVADLELYLAVP